MAAPLREALSAHPSSPGTPGGELAGRKTPERPPSGYVGIVSTEKVWRVAVQNGTRHDFTLHLGQEDPLSTVLPSLFSRLQEIDPNTHWRTLGATGLNGQGRDVAAESWKQFGASTIVFEGDHDTDPSDVLASVQQKHTPSGVRKIDTDPDGRIHSSRLVRFEDYRPLTKERVWKENIAIIDASAVALTNTVVMDENTTPSGGGVAGMDHPKQRFIDSRNEVEREKIANGEVGHPIEYWWQLADKRIDATIAAKHNIDLNDPELLAKYGEVDPKDPEQRERINISKLTKQRHVLLQNDAEPNDTYTKKDDDLYHAWSETQYEHNLKPVLMKLRAQGKEIVLKAEDQQIWGQLPYIRQDFPDHDKVVIIARNHIHSNAELAQDPSTPQHAIVESIMKDLGGNIDAFIAHRSHDPGRDEFLFRDADGNIDPRIADITMYAEASFDDWDGLGRPIMDTEKPFLYAENQYNLYESGQSPDNFDLPSIGHYARDDESKDKKVGMLAYVGLAKKLQQDGVPVDQIPQYRDVAMAAGDDPSGTRIHWAYLIGLHPELAATVPKDIQNSFKGADKEVIEQLQDAIAGNEWIADKIKKYRFDYDNYDDRNRRAIEELDVLAVQTPRHEGCEDEASRRINDGTYILVRNVGGLPPQVEDGVSGRIIEMTDDDKEIDAYEGEMYSYFTAVYPDPEKRAAVKKQVKGALKPQYTTVHNVAREIGAAALVKQHREKLPSMVRGHRDATGHFPFVHDLLEEYKPKPETATLPAKQDIYVAPLPHAENSPIISA